MGINKLSKGLANWLSKDIDPPREYPLSSFERVQDEIKPGDVLLIEGRSRMSRRIRKATHSAWTHSALYIGRLYEINDPEFRQKIEPYVVSGPDEPLLIESILGKGVIITLITHYKEDHIRICRPKGITRKDVQKVIAYAISKLGSKYDIRHFFDLWRLWTWVILATWRSTLFVENPSESIKFTCPQLIAQAFQSVNFPILPLIRPKKNEKGVEVLSRNPRLYTPGDFDFSPFFEIVKYPIVEFTDPDIYHMLIAAKHEKQQEHEAEQERKADKHED